MNKEEHIKRHLLLHNHLDELMADFIMCTNKMPSKSSIMELATWSHEQTVNPKEADHNNT